jgi:hypothetical protein
MAEDLQAHSDLPPSSADKWLKCHGWMRQTYEARQRDTSSPAAEEGTRAHAYFESHLRRHLFNDGTDILDSDAPQEMQDYLLPMLEWTLALPGTLLPEERVDFGAMFGYVDLTGTSDALCWDKEGRKLYVVDLKYGRGIVEPKENAQLMLYALGCVDYFGLDFSNNFDVDLTILQPRPYHADGPIRTWSTTSATLQEFAKEVEKAIQGNYGSGKLVAGDHCRHYCPSFGACPAAAQHARELWKTVAVEEEDQ